jgi:rhodanese-related sulfurtransferase
MSLKKTSKQLVAEANAVVTTWTVAEALPRVGDPTVVFVDIREPEEVARTGAVPGAVVAPRGMLEFYADPEAASHKPALAGKQLVLYCVSSGRSALAARDLQAMGLDVVHVGGGINAWLAAGGPVEPR